MSLATSLTTVLSARTSSDEAHEEQDQENDEQNLGDASRRTRDAPEAQDPGYQSHYQEHYGPL